MKPELRIFIRFLDFRHSVIVLLGLYFTTLKSEFFIFGIIMSALGVSFAFLAERIPSSAIDHTVGMYVCMFYNIEISSNLLILENCEVEPN